MAGERAVYFVELAERGAQRVRDRLVLIADRYGVPADPNDDVITFAEMMQHYDDYGHLPGAEDCGHPLCEKAKRMIAGALAQIARGGQ